jgi:hypothetical protein
MSFVGVPKLEAIARFARQALEKATLVVKPESEISTSGRD